jgi:hypothetical protein
MSIFIRQLDKALWFRTKILEGEDVSADAITNCLKTKHNSLSVWNAKSEDIEEVDEAVLALISGKDHVETIDIIPLLPDKLDEKGIENEPSWGKTLLENPIEKHRDLINLTYSKLGIIAYHIADRIKEKKIIRYTEGRQKELLKRAIETGRLDIAELPEDIRKKIISTSE